MILMIAVGIVVFVFVLAALFGAGAGEVTRECSDELENHEW